MRGLAAHNRSIDFFIGGRSAVRRGTGRIGRPDAVAGQRLRLAGRHVHVETPTISPIRPFLAHSRRPRSACQDVKAKLSVEMKDAGTETRLSVETRVQADTGFGKVIAGLSGKTKPDAY